MNGDLIISTPRMTIALQVVDGIIKKTPPIARWMRGKDYKEVIAKVLMRDYTISLKWVGYV